MMATFGWVSICVVWMRNQAVEGWRAAAAELLRQGERGLLCSRRSLCVGCTSWRHRRRSGWGGHTDPSSGCSSGGARGSEQPGQRGCLRVEKPFRPRRPKGGQSWFSGTPWRYCPAPLRDGQRGQPLCWGRGVTGERGGRRRSRSQEWDGRACKRGEQAGDPGDARSANDFQFNGVLISVTVWKSCA